MGAGTLRRVGSDFFVMDYRPKPGRTGAIRWQLSAEPGNSSWDACERNEPHAVGCGWSYALSKSMASVAWALASKLPARCSNLPSYQGFGSNLFRPSPPRPCRNDPVPVAMRRPAARRRSPLTISARQSARSHDARSIPGVSTSRRASSAGLTGACGMPICDAVMRWRDAPPDRRRRAHTCAQICFLWRLLVVYRRLIANRSDCE